MAPPILPQGEGNGKLFRRLCFIFLLVTICILHLRYILSTSLQSPPFPPPWRFSQENERSSGGGHKFTYKCRYKNNSG
jgi:hypothetical protein